MHARRLFVGLLSVALLGSMAPLISMALVTSTAVGGEPLFETSLVFPPAPNDQPNYRIPALLCLPGGTLLVLAEKRNNGPGDIGDHDIALKRSTDRGRTWSREQVLFDDADRPTTDLTVGYDPATKTVWLFFLQNKKRFVFIVTSTDGGATWAGPQSIHEQVTRPEWDRLGLSDPSPEEPPKKLGRGAAWQWNWEQRYGVGPGHAMLRLERGPKAGRLLVPARHREDAGRGRLRSFAHVFYSDDRGKTWQLGGTIGQDTSECQLVELASGDVMVVSRNESSRDAPDNLRHLASISRDGGETWGPVRRVEELITPRCHGSVERYSLAGQQDRNRLLFSSPASPFRQEEHPYGRYNLSVRLSYDEGQTWTAGRTIWPHPGSYSDLAVLDDGTIGIVYERGPKGSTHYWDAVHFARFNLDWVTSGHDTGSLDIHASP